MRQRHLGMNSAGVRMNIEVLRGEVFSSCKLYLGPPRSRHAAINIVHKSANETLESRGSFGTSVADPGE